MPPRLPDQAEGLRAPRVRPGRTMRQAALLRSQQQAQQGRGAAGLGQAPLAVRPRRTGTPSSLRAWMRWPDAKQRQRAWARTVVPLGRMENPRAGLARPPMAPCKPRQKLSLDPMLLRSRQRPGDLCARRRAPARRGPLPPLPSLGPPLLPRPACGAASWGRALRAAPRRPPSRAAQPPSRAPALNLTLD